MELVQVYECLCDLTRLRLLNVLTQGPLCVCHFQSVLNEPQVKISKHLGYLRTRGLVECERRGNWMVYRLPRNRPRALAANLACLQDCAPDQPVFRRDLARLKLLAPTIAAAHRRSLADGAAAPTDSCGCTAPQPRRATTAGRPIPTASRP